jgi:hypothetical protein
VFVGIAALPVLFRAGQEEKHNRKKLRQGIAFFRKYYIIIVQEIFA